MAEILRDDRPHLLRLTDEPLTLPPEVAALAAENWERRLAEQPALFDGPTLVAAPGTDARTLEIPVARSCYSHYLAVSDGVLPSEWCHRHVWAGVLVRAADGACLHGRMSDTTKRPGHWQLPGGAIDLDDVDGDRIDPADCARRELLEEVGLDLGAIGDPPLVPWAVADRPNGNIGYLYEVRTGLEQGQVEEIFAAHLRAEEAAGRAPEFTAIRWVAPGQEWV